MKAPDHKQLSDKELIDLILLEGKNDQFSVLYHRYLERVRNKCWTLVRSKAVVDDLVQDIFMKAMDNLPKFRQSSSFSTWLYSITYNHCIEYLRKNKRIRYEEWADQLDLPDEVDEEDLEEILEMRTERVHLLLEMLKPEDKAILVLKYKDGLRIKAIMEILRIEGESAAKMKINRAKKRIVAYTRSCLQKRNKRTSKFSSET